MRRAQFDENSQPHRQLATNPAMLSTWNPNVLRTNLALNPTFELSSGTTTLRTNLCTNPRGVNAFGPYSVAPTITPNVAITGHPEGITTANRVEYNGQANPGVALLTTVEANTAYMITAWVFHETLAPTPGSAALAQESVTSDSGRPDLAQGVWQKHQWQRTTTTSTNNFGFRVSAQTGAGSFLITGVIIEKATVAGPYFDGATPASGDFSYSWGGTADASVSHQRASNAQYWANSTGGISYQTVTQAYSGAKGGAALTKGTNGDGLYLPDVNVTAGQSYTVSAWVKVTSAVPNFAVVLRFKDSAQAILSDVWDTVHTSLVVGDYVRISKSGVAPTNATKLQPMFRIYATHTPTTFYIDNAMVEASPVLSSYFDGTTPAAGDFTYNWTGAAHHTTSEQKASPPVSLQANRSSAALDSRFWGYQSTAEDGAKTAKWVSPAGTANAVWRIAGFNTAGWNSVPIKAGGQYTLWFRYRASGWGATSNFATQISDATGANAVVGISPYILLNTTGWQEYRRTFTAVRDATAASMLYIPLPLTPQTATDGIFEIREWGLYEGEYNGDYIDGTKPFSKWDGVANASTSVGYPPQLFDFAGKPELDYTVAGNYVLPGGYGEQEARTFYSVIEVLTEIYNQSNPWVFYGENALHDNIPNSWVQLRQDGDSSNPSGTNRLFYRRTGAQGVGYNVKPVSRYVVAWGIDANGKMFLSLNGSALTTDTQVMSIPHQRINIIGDAPSQKHHRTMMFRGMHDDATRLAISRYLGNKYGAAVA